MYDELVKALRGCVLSNPCDGCPYYDKNGPSEKCATLNIAAADAIEELTRRCEQFQYMPPPAWIPVTERLPEKKKAHYLCLLDDDSMAVVYWSKVPDWVSKGEWTWHNPNWKEVTHWMPLPEPPMEEVT